MLRFLGDLTRSKFHPPEARVWETPVLNAPPQHDLGEQRREQDEQVQN
jgi:hypothetical protein